jgi:hypothetical protein
MIEVIIDIQVDYPTKHVKVIYREIPSRKIIKETDWMFLDDFATLELTDVGLHEKHL